MKVVVTGGTGFVGRAFVTTLCERGDDVVVLSRHERGEPLGPRAHCKRGSGKVVLATWSPYSSGDWMRIVDGADAVVHLAGAAVLEERWSEERRRVLWDSRVRSAELLAEAIQRADNKPKVFVSGSSVGYYGMKEGDRILAEDAPPGDDFLAKLCVDWENAAASSGIRTVTPRIGIALGRGGGMFAKMAPMFRAYMGGPIGDGRQYYAWIHVADCVRALEHAIEREDCVGAFNFTAPDPVTANELATAFGESMDRPALMRVPPIALKLRLGESADVLLTGQRAIPKKLVEQGFAFVFPELRSALADLVAD